ncbi:hypothetical protein LshimejAT787_0411390 [Lyophyllum shimeji]|uniref:CCHC-type domain-containing protein n=1 Tax=Lyophyllum shimeji TaxID=47721 RepID=A0A9P3PMC8_LYOSH|nr:hypothetical protein LshimejAT787_0411390 [Lyophyllum shimeji]
MPDENTPLFWGDGREGENPQDFINTVERKFVGKADSGADKIDYLRLSLKASSDADAWYRGLDTTITGTWTTLVSAFNTKWPVRVIATKTKEEKTAILAATVLKEEDVGKRITVNGVEELSHIAWANKVERLAEAIPDRDGLLISATRKALPIAVRSLLLSYGSWSTFCDAVRALPLERIEENQLEEEKKKRSEAKTDRLLLAATQQTPSKALAATLRNINIGAPIPAPRFNTAPNTNATRPSNTTNSSPFYSQPPNAGMFPTRTPAQRWADVVSFALIIHPDTPAGRALYEAQVNEWARKHGNRGPNESRPYPLSPGSCPVGSGECWTCGYTGHRGDSCSANRVIPQLERRWRSIASSIKRSLNGVTPTTNATPVNFVSGGDQWYSQEEYNAQVIHDYLEAQAAAQEQGKAEGSST